MNEPSQNPFLTDDDRTLAARFIGDGYVIIAVEDMAALTDIRSLIADLAARHLGADSAGDAGVFLDTIGDRVVVSDLNDLRLSVINGMNAETWLRPAYYRLAAQALASIVGNELAMQRRINLSIQLPDDDSSLLPVHADVWSGDSPFEVVLWVPLVDCYKTKSMYLLPPSANIPMQAAMHTFAGRSAEDVYQAIQPRVSFLDVPFGNVLLFSQNLMHGNRINEEAETRWSMNCRFKGVFTPYADKKLGEFFEPITLRPASDMGLQFVLPSGFADDE